MTYEDKLTARRERLEVATIKARKRSEEAFDKARGIIGVIPFGQPILVDHHSAGKHRRDLERSDQAMRKGFQELKKAEELELNLRGVGHGGISSDDPEAIEKLKAKLEGTKNSREAKRIRDRIAALEVQRTRVYREYLFGTTKFVENVEVNRVQIFFDGKPNYEMIQFLKSRGFKWARSIEAWQRMLNNAGIRAAQEIAERCKTAA